MLTDRQIIVNFGVQHCDDEGAWLLCSADECHAGED